MSTDLSITVTAAVPSAEPAAFRSSKSIITWTPQRYIIIRYEECKMIYTHIYKYKVCLQYQYIHYIYWANILINTVYIYYTYIHTHTTLHIYSTYILAVIEIQHRDRGASWDNCLEIIPAASDTTAVALQELSESDRHLFFHYDRVVDVACIVEV